MAPVPVCPAPVPPVVSELGHKKYAAATAMRKAKATAEPAEPFFFFFFLSFFFVSFFSLLLLFFAFFPMSLPLSASS